MRSKNPLYPLAIFAGGISYALGVVNVKLTYLDGFVWQQSAFSQALFALILFAVCTVAAIIGRKRLKRVTLRDALKMMALGACGCTTTLLYAYALSLLPVSIALTLMFQYAWIGQIVQAALQKIPPHPLQVAAALIIVVGTLFASGFIGADTLHANLLGCACALGSALSCTGFMHFNATVGQEYPWMERGVFVCLGGVLLTGIFCPDYFPSGVIFEGMAWHGFMLGLTSMFLPVLLFGFGAPHVPTGLSSILAASELPGGVITSYLVLGETITFSQGIGVVIVLAGIALSQAPALIERRRAKAAHAI